MAELRNVAIIAHVDHGKTTVVDALLRASGVYRDNQIPTDQALDRNKLERERGITILAKNTSVTFDDLVINIVDTPGHHDFGGEVERVLSMVDGVLLVVDAAEGPMPQTTFVLKKALKRGLTPLVLINKIDRQDARIDTVVSLLLDVFIRLGADDDLIDFPIIYGSAKRGVMFASVPPLPLDEATVAAGSVWPLVAAIRDCLPAPVRRDGALQMQVSNVVYDAYLGRLAVGRVARGTLALGQSVVYGRPDQAPKSGTLSRVLRYVGLNTESVDHVACGDIVAVSGLFDIMIGDTITAPTEPDFLPVIDVDAPTLAMTFQLNDTPYAAEEAKYVTGRHMHDRLMREVETNLAMTATPVDGGVEVKGRGELHLSILIETMRREGYAFMVSRPRVVMKTEDKVRLEPELDVVLDVPTWAVGRVMDQMGRRGGTLVAMDPPDRDLVRLTFVAPARGLIGYRFDFVSDTKGLGVFNSDVRGYVPYQGPLATRGHGVLVATEAGEATRYALHAAEERGQLFIRPGTRVYEGMIVGTTMRRDDVALNVCRKKAMTNMRAAGADESLKLSPPIDLTLEQAMEFIAEDELIEITPVTFRLRKRILNHTMRLRAEAKDKERSS